MQNAEKDVTVDLVECETENLTHRGLVQPFGRLAVYDEHRNLIAKTANAENLHSWLTANVLETLSDTPCKIATTETSEIFAHKTHNSVVVEDIVPTETGMLNLADVLADAEERLRGLKDPNLYHCAQAFADAVKTVASYDRVMVYRFHSDWSGEVIAEARNANLTPYLGLRYPASDIPSQARELYLRNVIRVVGDVEDVDHAVLSNGDQPDLSMAILRSVSRYHVTYLRNMGVRATLTVSIIRDGALWGMLACHHNKRRFPPDEIRTACLRLTQIFVELLDYCDEVQTMEAEKTAQRVMALADPSKHPRAGLLARLMFSSEGWLAWLDADGLIVGYGDHFVGAGILPAETTIRSLSARWPDAGTYETTLPAPTSTTPWMPPPAGVCAVRTKKGHWVAAFRTEMIRNVLWGGNPDKAVEIDGQGKLSPRRSFAAWAQTMRGHPKPWQDRDKALLAAVGRLLDAAEPFSEPDFGQGMRKDAGLSIPSLIAPHVPALVLESIADGQQRVVHATPAWLRLLGMTPDKVIGQDLTEVFATLGINNQDASLPAETQHLTVFSPDRGQLILAPQMRATLLLMDGTRQAMNVLIFGDATRVEGLTSALKASVEDSETARNSRTAILRSLSHEFRTPLNAILGFSELIATDTKDINPTLHGYAEEIRKAGKDLLRILEAVLDVARLQTGRIPLRLAKIALAETLETVKTRLDAFAKDRSITVAISVTPPDCTCVTDGALLRQALNNLVENAIKFSPRNSRVLISAVRETTRITISVEDQGPGIPEHLSERIFEPFVQIGDTRTDKNDGIGLGLYLARSIAESLGGVLRYERLQGGSRFRLILPRQDNLAT